MTATDEVLDWATLPWGSEGENGVHRTLPPPPGTWREEVRYEEQALLGRGGMGDVHACQDRRIGRTVARKTLHRAGDADAARRFLAEARLQGQLEHPTIVPVYDVGTDDAGTPFFTMKRVRGRTLAAVLSARATGEEAWSTRRLLGAISTVALAIDYAHGRGVVHGDLKPQNVMLGRFGEVHVLDWGCATEAVERSGEHAIESELVDLRALACSGREIVGTPGYLSPEQAHGVRGEPASDVYALGAILFEVIAGEPLHRGRTPLALLVSALTGAVRRPSERVPGLVVPRELEDLVERALDPEPALRPTARELAAGLEAVLDREAGELAQRRAADRHAKDARENARAALERGDESARSSALRDAGRALALDPENAEATDVLTRLLVQPPTELPPEARADIEASERTVVRYVIEAMRMRTWIWVLVAPLAVALGVRSVSGTLGTVALILVPAIAFTLAARRRAVSARVRLGLLALALAAIASFGGVFGSFVIVPLFAATTTQLLSVGLDARQRRVAMAMGLAAVYVPLALEALGVLPPSMTVSHDGITLHTRLVYFDPMLTWALLGIGHAIAIPMNVIQTGRGWDAVDRARRRLALRTWQLEHAFARASRPPAA